MKQYYVYIMTNKGRTTLYIGMTNSLVKRVSQHRAREVPGFTATYNLNRLVYYEAFNDVRDAISREKQLKGLRRSRKESLVDEKNPRWLDLGDQLLGIGPAPPSSWKTIARDQD